MKKYTAIAALILAPLLAIPAFGGGSVGDLAEKIAEGKKAFENACVTCHKLDVPLAKTMGRDQWNARIDDMVSKGLKISAQDKGLAVDYLAARSVFEEKCSVCHATDKIKRNKMTLLSWQTTVDRMAAKDRKILTEEEKNQIVAFLAVVFGLPSSF
jgi:cytochrome c5